MEVAKMKMTRLDRIRDEYIREFKRSRIAEKMIGNKLRCYEYVKRRKTDEIKGDNRGKLRKR